MKEWEDIVKERLEGYESTLPEGSYAEFQRLRADGREAAPRKKVYPLAWAAAVAVAASLAAVLLLWQPSRPEGGVQLVQQLEVRPEGAGQQPPARIEGAVQQQAEETPVADDSAAGEPASAPSLLAQAAPVKPVRPATRPAMAQPEPQAEPRPESMDVPEKVEETSSETPVPEEDKETPVTVREEPFIPTGSPFIPEDRPGQRVNLKVAAPVAGGVLGTGALALLVSSFAPRSAAELAPGPGNDYYSDKPGGLNPIGEPVENSDVKEEQLLDSRHAFPLRLGVSARIPVWNRLYLNTGLEYSRYASSFTYLLMGEKTQVAQYLGLPLRLDWVFPLGKRFDAYAGAGMQADYCLSVRRGGVSVRRDGIALSLGAAAGVQLNLTQNVGLYAEPRLSWRVPTGATGYQTYRTRHPWMFSVSAGVRINIEKKGGK